MRTARLLALLLLPIACAQTGRGDDDLNPDQAPVQRSDADASSTQTPIAGEQDAGQPADLSTQPDLTVISYTPDGFRPGARIGDACYLDAHCASALCIGAAEPEAGVCAECVCTADNQCSAGRPCILNMRSDRDRRPMYCKP